MLNIEYIENRISDSKFDILKGTIPKCYEESKKFKIENARNSYLLGKYITVNKLGIEEDDIFYSSSGKPYSKSGKYFNISHTDDYIVYVDSDCNIGIDIEKIDKKSLEIIEYAFNNDEIKYIHDGNSDEDIIHRLIYLWTIKESVYKASGILKKIEPKDISVNDSGKIVFFDETYYICSKEMSGNIITTASIIKYDGLVLNKFTL